jgi:flagellar basal-body rod protein FlgB
MVFCKEAVMQIEGIFGTTINLLGKSVDMRVKNQNLISSNVANAETPNYVPKTLAFEDELQGALKGARGKGQFSAAPHARHIPIRGSASGNSLGSVTGKVIETPASTPGKDGNAVELENEMGKMAENQLMFNASVQMLSKKFEGLRSAIREGK